MEFSTHKNITKDELFHHVYTFLISSMHVRSKDADKPWGGFFVIEEEDTDEFIRRFFPHLNKAALGISGKLSPKILLVEPGKRLSWQYHFRRAEIWKLIGGEAAVITSETDTEEKEHVLTPGEIIELPQGTRHRLVGKNNWGIIAEIWRHTDADHPSDEDDIVRLQDDYGR